MRMVCTGWRNAVDSHSFWPEFTLLLDPSRHHSSAVSDIQSARLAPSTPSVPTLFHRARSSTLSACLACRLNHPSRLGYYPAVRKRLTFTSKFALAPTCEKHANNFCSGCMRENEPQAGRVGALVEGGTPSPGELAVPSLMLSQCNHGDVDENGVERFPRSLVCPDCRKAAIWNEIRLILHECARGGRMRGERSLWLYNEKVKDYIDFNVGTAFEMGYAAVEEQWLIDHTRWVELSETALQLQNHEKALKLQFLRTAAEETPAQKRMRLAREAELRGEDQVGKETEEEAMEMEMLYRSWWKELEDDDLSSDDEEEDELLNDKFRGKLKAGCINDFISDRIRYAFWVSPSDEVSKIVTDDRDRRIDRSSVIHTMFPDIALNSAHPFSRYIEFTFEPAQACAEAAGLISLVPNDPSSSPISDGRFDPFLPPDRLLRALDKTFAEMLSARTSTAMENIVSMVREYCDDDDDKAEEVCENMRVEDILGRLTAWQMWVPRSLADQMKLAEMQKEMEAEGEVDYEGEESEEDLEGTIEEVPTSRSGSPRVELVEGGEEEVHFTPVEVPPSDDYQPSPPSSSSPPLTLTLGKRKSTDVFPEPTDKRARPSTSPNERERKLEQLPQTPRKQILSQDDTSGGLAVDTSASAAVVASDGGGAGGGGGLKRKEPPSPAVNHIDKGRKEVTPPPGPKFDLADGHGYYGDKRTRVTGDLVQEASSAPVSSLPGSPTPMKKRVGGGGGGEEEEGGGFEVDVETEEMSRRGTSVTETVGTVPVTPEEGMSLGGETVIDPKLVSMDPEGSDVDDPQAQSVQTIDNPPLVELVTPSPSPSLSTFPARSRSPSTVSAADSYSSGSSSIPLDGDGDGDGTLTPLTSATARLARYVQRAHASTPFIPLPVCRLLPHPDHPAHPNQGGQGVQLPVNLGEGANRVLLNTWYEARGELRECKCRICERARRKAWESLEAMRQLVASGEVTWETLLS
ncbi:expressed protein [Cryptococcus deneoformans JEC21]|uniref:Expressed protein n=1 Tax=Cryptococcus deneoformans (strain JEC21 / ATCC MYA-565) TaxID=214684 RepID=Q5K798_CRYD1|nr:expressed protein [Cryptococcus neoformans var. neoformans JEC21]AAW47076.2 expressed protein [Cryptococcus neoformans var. neoformans JEC21]